MTDKLRFSLAGFCLCFSGGMFCTISVIGVPDLLLRFAGVMGVYWGGYLLGLAGRSS